MQKEIVIKISEEVYKGITGDVTFRDDEEAALDAIRNGTVLPENPTNGDMIKALFPNFQINEEWKATRHFELRTDCTEITGIATSDWWNSPYKRGDTE